jgi:FkbM family methyltransferase
MKKKFATLINLIDRLLHKNFDFLNVSKAGKFNKNYEWIYEYLEQEEVDLTKKTFIEVGSRDVLDSLDIITKFNFLKAHVFEASHVGIIESIKNLRNNIDFSKKIVFYPLALGEENKITKFYELTHIKKKQIRPNIGASSVFGDDSNLNHSYEVPILKLDTLNIDFSNNYLIIMDCEGSEFPVLKGAKKALKHTKYICLESNFSRKIGNCLDIVKILESNGYRLIDCDWPNTSKGYLPDKDEVGINQFCLLFENFSQ